MLTKFFKQLSAEKIEMRFRTFHFKVTPSGVHVSNAKRILEFCAIYPAAAGATSEDVLKCFNDIRSCKPRGLRFDGLLEYFCSAVEAARQEHSLREHSHEKYKR